MHIPPYLKILFLKGGKPYGAGLSLRIVTDKRGRKVQQWVKNATGHARQESERQADLFAEAVVKAREKLQEMRGATNIIDEDHRLLILIGALGGAVTGDLNRFKFVETASKKKSNASAKGVLENVLRVGASAIYDSAIEAVRAHSMSDTSPELLFSEEVKRIVAKWGKPNNAPATEGKKAVTKEDAANFQAGQVVEDGKGQQYLARGARQGYLEAHPIVNGKAVVNRDSGVMFHLDPNTASGYPERRHDPVFAVSSGEKKEGKAETPRDVKPLEKMPVAEEDGQENHAMLSAALRRGDLGAALKVLEPLSYNEANEAIAHAGFTMGYLKKKTTQALIASVQDQLLRAAKAKKNGFDLREKPLAKSLPVRVLFMKSHVKQYTDKNGRIIKEHDDKRTKKMQQAPAPAARPAAQQPQPTQAHGYGTHNVEEGDSLNFKAGAFSGGGTVKSVGKDGAVVEDESGRDHNVHWHEIVGRGGEGKVVGEVASIFRLPKGGFHATSFS